MHCVTNENVQVPVFFKTWRLFKFLIRHTNRLGLIRFICYGLFNIEI